jgi:hypothetical protein
VTLTLTRQIDRFLWRPGKHGKNCLKNCPGLPADTNSAGARGAGEIGVTEIPAAIAKAVYNATGQRVRDFPITLDNLLLPAHALERATADNI